MFGSNVENQEDIDCIRILPSNLSKIEETALYEEETSMPSEKDVHLYYNEENLLMNYALSNSNYINDTFSKLSNNENLK
jgi:hypothetical protein